ncbi:hypothetical protein N665_0317s0048 [Sinapis alba]|nr:hypothetical protein N665_0317s0048 [Sinapis alba]
MLDKCITLLQSYGLSSLKKLKQVHAFSIRNGVSISNSEMGKHLIFYLVSLPSPPPMSYAHKIFSKIEKPINVFIWNTLIRGYNETGDSVSALSLYREMRLSGFVEPDTHTYPFLLKAVAKMADVRLGETIHSVVVRSGFGSLIFAQNSLLHLYANCGDEVSAYKVFDEMPVKDLVAWNSVINGFAENGKPNEALELYSEMDSKGIKADGFTIVSLLSACAKIGALALGKRVHVYMIKVGLTGNLHSSNVLLDFYARCGRVEEAKTLFSEMVDKNSVSWTSLIVGLAVNGFGKEAIEIFKDMESKEGLLPCEITFVGILYACSHCGMVDEGFEYFRRMREEYKIEPRIEHFGCMVDLLARAGEVKKAYEYITKMPMQPNVVIWRTLLGACTVHGDSDLAELARIKILQLEPNHSGDYVLLSNMYASEQRWSDVQKIRRQMLEDGVRKVPGHSLVEVGNRVHEFLMGDKSHPQSEQIYAKLKEMSDRLRREGYVPQISNVYVDVEEEEKENALVYHSEKIAIAFMLISTPERSAIRVVKNLRVCADCHLAIKLVSKMGDTSHLEKMGRELKCPICLSLFNSAASLSCNHVFCNECIVKSMKVDATCPVCKIPFHRREIRGAPHMDSLVSIYKNMEDASGVNMFVSQNNPSPSDKEKHVGDSSIEKANDKKRQGSSKSRTSKRRGYNKTKETDLDAPGHIVMKPSSQTRKRVQLSQNQSSGSLTKSTESVESAEKLKDYTEKTVIRLNEHPSLNKEDNLAPFFWLRDEDDGENLSQPAESDSFLDVTPVDVPSFSDLKDSDHDSPSKAVEQERPNPGDMIDSEMFEWTQRPSSPEILPSPVKVKALSRGEIDLTQKKLSKGASSNEKRKAGTARNTVAKPRFEVSKEDYVESSAGASISEKQEAGGTSGTSTRKDENVKAKRATRNKGQTSRVDAGVNTHVEAEVKQGTKRKRSSVKVSPNPPVAGSSELSTGTDNVGKGDQELTHGSADTQSGKQSPAEKYSLRKRRKSSASSFPKYSSGTTEMKTSEKRSELDSCSVPSRVTQPRGKKTLSVELNQVGDRQDSPNKKKPSVDKGIHTMQVLEKSSTMSKPSLGGNALLRRCDGPQINELTCAFCHSSEDTEASGEMAHYHRGEPVSADFSDGSKVIHVHKNCAEWAPNVYFNNLTAVNLDAELTRSRRITCSFCGLKGAALGCYNPSCKSSFHVTCAKQMPKCRWDNKNFVMLCPSDASSKLPCEETSPKERKRKRTRPKGPHHSQPNQVSEKPDISELQSKPFHGLSKKLVLCCSGLTDEEKSVISEFAELSGVTISRKWEPRVTHIIASINENGACKRTLKFMMGVLEGKWILSIGWIKACMKNTEYVIEEPYEISIDVHGTRQGPYIGRQRALNKKPKLFNGLKFYIMGDFELAYKGYLQDMIVAAGGTILRRRPIANDDTEASTVIVFSVEPSKKKTLTQRRYDAEALAKSSRARAASSSWVLDSIAGCQILYLV